MQISAFSVKAWEDRMMSNWYLQRLLVIHTDPVTDHLFQQDNASPTKLVPRTLDWLPSTYWTHPHHFVRNMWQTSLNSLQPHMTDATKLYTHIQQLQHLRGSIQEPSLFRPREELQLSIFFWLIYLLIFNCLRTCSRLFKAQMLKNHVHCVLNFCAVIF